MLGGLFKPKKWLNKEARVRLQAIPELAGDSAELIQLAQNDDNTGVRLEAIAYLTDFPTLISLGKRVDSVGERARHRLIGLTPGNNRHDALLTDVFDWLATNPTLVNTLARDTERDAALRKLAIMQLTDEQTLFSIASQDTSPNLQFQAASQLQSLELLQQLEKLHGKTNKRLRQLLKERMDIEQARQQRTATLNHLCVSLEGLGRSGQWPQDRTRYKVLLQSWKQQNEQEPVSAELSKRFHDAEQEFLCRLEKHDAEQAAQAPRLALFEQCLQEAATLQQTLAEPSEALTLSAIDRELEQLQERWVTAEQLPEDRQQTLNTRWVEQFVSLTDARDAISGDLQALENLQACCQQAEKLRHSDRFLQAKQLTDLQSDWTRIKRPHSLREATAALESRFHQAISSLSTRLEKQAAQRNALLQDMEALLTQMEADLEAEKYGEAIDLHAKVSHLLHDHSDLPAKDTADIRHRLHVAAPMVMEFKDWRRWGTDQAREHLIETAERLERDDSMDPQQRAKEIKALREEWRRLAQMEPGQQRKQWKTFDTKVTAAYQVSKQHFAEQAAERNAHRQEREAICTALEALNTNTDWENADWHAVYTEINHQRKLWKQCGTVGHKEWKAINQRFNTAMDALEEHLSQERGRNFAFRQQLVEEAVALLEQDDIPAAIEQAKGLQAEWKISIPSRPKDEQRLWKQFRAPIDEMFERLKEARKAQRSETDERITAKDACCQQLEAILELSDDEFQQAVKEQANIRQTFMAIRDLPKAVHQKLEERFQRAEQALQDKRTQIRTRQKLAELDALAAESAARKQQEDTPTTQQAEQQSGGELLCLQLEILLDAPTPSEFQRARMEYQIAKMSESMRSRSVEQDTGTTALGLLKQWYQLGAMPAEALVSQQARIEAIRQRMT